MHERIPESEAGRLRRWNFALAALHAAQAIVILALANDFSIPVTVTYLQGPPGSDTGATTVLFEMEFGWAVAAFLLLAALDHLIVASVGRRYYEDRLARGQGPFRWYEYSLSASLMIVLIAMLTGIEAASALIAIFGANAAMILFGLVMERANPPGAERVDWRPFVFGCIAGAAPWIAIAVQIWSSEAEGGDVPGFVFAIFASLFVLFFSFAANMALHYARAGRWRDYLFCERGYLVLSLAAKSALAWQVFGSTLAA